LTAFRPAAKHAVRIERIMVVSRLRRLGLLTLPLVALVLGLTAAPASADTD